MVQEKDVEQVRRSYKSDPREDSCRSGGYNLKKATALFSLSMVGLVILMFVAVSGNVGAINVGQVGGIVLEGEAVIGNNVDIYPYPTETAACYSNTSSNVVGSRDEVAAGALKADIGQLRVPANKQLTVKKDIKTPNIFNISAFRIKVNRTKVAQNPSYPPSASLDPATGDVRLSFIDRFQAAGIDAGTGPNDGYADITFERTRNVTAGDTFNITVDAVGYYDYTPIETGTYDFSQGRNPNRYVDDVEAQGGSLSNLGTGDDAGYFPYTNVNNAPNNVSAGGTPPMSVDATTTDASFAGASPIGTPSGRDTNSYIDGVTLDTLSNTNTGDNGGYADFTGQSTSNLNRDNVFTITVNGNKKNPTFEPAGDGDGSLTVAPDPNSNYGGQTNFNACNTGFGTDKDCASIVDVEFGTTIDRNSGDDNGYHPDGGDMDLITGTDTPVYPGGTFDLTSEFIAETDGGDPSISVAKAWIDWNQDGVMDGDEEIFLGTAAAENDDSGACGRSAGDPDCVSDRVTVPVNVPDDAETGSTVLRVVNAMCFECTSPPDTDYPADVTSGSFNVDHLEKEDYLVNVTQKLDVEAWADWNQDGILDTSGEQIEVGRVVDKSSTYSISRTFSPPPDALSGSSLLRVQHRNNPGQVTPNPNDGEYVGETEDYTVNLERKTDSAVHALVDWNQNGEFDTFVQEEEDFEFGFLSGWTTNGEASAETDIANSGSYSINISTASTGNQLVSPTVDTSQAEAVKLSFWFIVGSDLYSEYPDGGENIVVEYLDSGGTWQKLREIRSYNTVNEENELGKSETIELSLTEPGALHSNFQVRFRGNGVGSSGFDYWHIDDPKISTTTEAQRIASSTSTGIEESYLGSLDVPPDAAAGSTLLRVVYQQDGYLRNYPQMAEAPGRRTFDGEVEDYSLNVEPDTSFVRAWIDWNRDGDFFDADEGPIFIGQRSGPSNTQEFTVSETVTAPDPLPSTGAAVLRVKHEQKQRQTDLTRYDVDGFRGENEDYTVILSDTAGDISDTGNITLGDSSLVVSRLTAENIDLRTTLIDEDYSDNTFENPRFGPDGELTISGDQLRLTNVTGLLHRASFSILALEDVSISVEYNPTDPQVSNQYACEPLGSYQP